MPQELNPNVQFRGLIADMSDTVDEAILHMLESDHPTDTVLASLAEARGHVVRMNHALKIVTISIVGDQPRVYADELPPGARPKPLGIERYLDKADKELPKLQKQPTKHTGKDVKRPGISKMKKSPFDFLCPTCLAEPHTRCFVMTGPGHKSTITEERRDDNWTHNKRAKLAADHNAAAIARYDREHFEAQS